MGKEIQKNKNMKTCKIYPPPGRGGSGGQTIPSSPPLP